MNVYSQWFSALRVGQNYNTMHYYAGTGSDSFDINFAGGYIDKSHVRAVIDDEGQPVTLTFVTPARVRLSRPVPVGNHVLIFRDTPKVLPLAMYSDGALLNASNMDRNAKQAVFVAAEMLDRFDTFGSSLETSVSQVSEALAVSAAALENSKVAIGTAEAAKALAESATQLVRWHSHLEGREQEGSHPASAIDWQEYGTTAAKVAAVVKDVLATPVDMAELQTTLRTVIHSTVLIPKIAPVLDYAPIINDAQRNLPYGSVIELEAESYPTKTSILRRAGISIVGKGVFATEIKYSGNGVCVQNERVSLKSRSGAVIGNNSGQYNTVMGRLTLSSATGGGIGIMRNEGWWAKEYEMRIEGFDIGQQDGTGSSSVTGSYWCVSDQVYLVGNRINLKITDFTNLCTWRNCRMSHAKDWDVYFEEPSSPLLLGMQGIRFEDTEFASKNQVFLGARIFNLIFDNVYFEGNGYAVYDGTNHSKGHVGFTGGTNIFGSKSEVSKIHAGVNGGNCQGWYFENMRTNLGYEPGGSGFREVVVMGPTANYFRFINCRTDNASGWVLTDERNFLYKNRAEIIGRNGESIMFFKRCVSDSAIANRSHVVVNHQEVTNIGVDVFDKGVDLGELGTTWKTVMEVPDFYVEYAFAFMNCKLTLGGRNPKYNNGKGAHFEIDVIGVNGTSFTPTIVTDRQYGTSNITLEVRAVLSGKSLLIQVRCSEASVDPFDQVFCAVSAQVAGKFTELCI
uniref:Tail protein n=1 Tax=Aeromonas phage vB_AdhaP_MF TaxID=3367373 RepID=A0AB74UJF7_9CAUD